MKAYEEKVDELSAKLVNGELQVSDIPDELIPDVVGDVMFDLPVSAMEEAVARMEGIVAAKEQVLAQKKHELAELDWQIQQFDNTQPMR